MSQEINKATYKGRGRPRKTDYVTVTPIKINRVRPQEGKTIKTTVTQVQPETQKKSWISNVWGGVSKLFGFQDA